MPVTPADIKKALVAAGFELYRTRGNEVPIANRVRDKLDRRFRCARFAPPTRSRSKWSCAHQRSDFPPTGPPASSNRARELRPPQSRGGYVESGSLTSPMPDPAEPERTLDTWYEVSFEKAVSSLEEAMVEVGFALQFEKTVRLPAPTSA